MDTVLFHKYVHPLEKFANKQGWCLFRHQGIKTQYNAINDNIKYLQVCQVYFSKKQASGKPEAYRLEKRQKLI